MKNMKFYITPQNEIQKRETERNLKHIRKPNSQGSKGEKALIEFFISLKDLIFSIETEAHPIGLGDLESDFLIVFKNGMKLILEFNGASHFTYSSFLPTKTEFHNYVKNYFLKKQAWQTIGYSFMAINDFCYFFSPIIPINSNDPIRKEILKIYHKTDSFYNSLRKKQCKKLIRALKSCSIKQQEINFNIIEKGSRSQRIRTTGNLELDTMLCKMYTNAKYKIQC